MPAGTRSAGTHRLITCTQPTGVKTSTDPGGSTPGHWRSPESILHLDGFSQSGDYGSAQQQNYRHTSITGRTPSCDAWLPGAPNTQTQASSHLVSLGTRPETNSLGAMQQAPTLPRGSSQDTSRRPNLQHNVKPGNRVCRCACGKHRDWPRQALTHTLCHSNQPSSSPCQSAPLNAYVQANRAVR